MLFDTHAHMDDHAFDTDREQLLADLPRQGIASIMRLIYSKSTTVLISSTLSLFLL